MTNAHIDAQILRGADGKPEFAVLPYAAYKALLGEKSERAYIPHEVVGKIVAGMSPCKAWREYRGLTQKEVAERLGISQSAYAQHETSETLRPSTRRKIAQALTLEPEQLL